MHRPLSALLFLMLAGPAVAEQPQAPSGGSAFCVWEIYVTLLNHAEICRLDVGSDMHVAMEQAVADIGRFIAENSEVTESALRSARAEELTRQRTDYSMTLNEAGVDVCDRASTETVSSFYRDAMTHQSPDELRAWTKRFVSVPRDPRQGGCL